MSNIILDTSTIIEAINPEINRQGYTLSEHFRSTFILISALVLCEDIYYDDASIQNALKSKSLRASLSLDYEQSQKDLHSLLKHIKPINLDNSQKAQVRIKTKELASLFLRNKEYLEEQKLNCNEDYFDQICGLSPDDIETSIFLLDDWKENSRPIETLIDYNKYRLFDDLARIFYYKSIQEITEVTYVPHSNRSKYFNSENIVPWKIVEDADFRNEYYRRLERQTGIKNVNIELPIVAENIFRKCKPHFGDITDIKFENILNHTIKLRNSTKAQNYRDGINTLVNYARNNEREKVDRTIVELKEAKKIWENDLSTHTLLTKLFITGSRVVGVKKELEVPRTIFFLGNYSVGMIYY